MEQTPPELIRDIAIVIRNHIERDATDFFQTRQNMIAEYGLKIAPYIDDGWRMAQEQIKNQVNVAEELLKAEESNKSRMLVRKGISVKITRKQRIGIVISLAWLVIAMAVPLGAYEFEPQILQEFLLFGILPVGVGWGIWWIFRKKE